jgi:hypothetical protein
MRKSILTVAAVGLVAALVAGGLVASNMGFKLNFALPDTSTTKTGTTVMALPFNQQTNLVDADDLLSDMNAVGGASNVQSVSRLDRSTDGLITYTGTAGANFLLSTTEAFYVTVNPAFNYIIVGSHDPAAALTFYAPGNATPDGVSKTGTNSFSLPYHTTQNNADGLLAEINAVGGGVAGNVAQWDDQVDGLDAYTGTAGNNFTLVPGKGYTVGLTAGSDITGYIPSHF